MAKQKLTLEQQPDVANTGLTYNNEELTQTLNVDVIPELTNDVDVNSEVTINADVIPEPYEPTIHDKYRTLIDKANSGYLTGYQFADLVAMAHWIEAKLNRGIAVNFQCPVCLIDLVQMFGRMEEK